MLALFTSVLVCVSTLWFCTCVFWHSLLLYFRVRKNVVTLYFCTCVCWHSLLLYLRVRKNCWHSLLLYLCVLALFASVLVCVGTLCFCTCVWEKMLSLFTSVLVCVGTLCFCTCVWGKKKHFSPYFIVLDRAGGALARRRTDWGQWISVIFKLFWFAILEFLPFGTIFSSFLLQFIVFSTF